MEKITIIKNMLLDAAKYPATDWLKVVLLGFILLVSIMGLLTQLNLFTLLFLILLPLPFGYLFRIIKTSFNGLDILPDFNSWKEMYWDGLKVLVAMFIYALPILIIFFITNQSTLTTTDLTNFTLLSLEPIILGSYLLLLVFIFIGLFELIGLANMALYDVDILAAFSFREIIRRISMIGWSNYLIYYLIIWIIFVLTALLSILSIIMLIGIIIIPLLIAPYFLVLMARFLALVFASSES
ncbi:MAG TPA: DUF4013 domain-containing protein [Methanobacterium sp.]|nr:DUF4013 domain-containing protein [Methanobacterium sp.]